MICLHYSSKGIVEASVALTHVCGRLIIHQVVNALKVHGIFAAKLWYMTLCSRADLNYE